MIAEYFTWIGWMLLSSLTSSRSKWLQQSEACTRLWQQKKEQNASRERKVMGNCLNFKTCIFVTGNWWSGWRAWLWIFLPSVDRLAFKLSSLWGRLTGSKLFSNLNFYESPFLLLHARCFFLFSQLLNTAQSQCLWSTEPSMPRACHLDFCSFQHPFIASNHLYPLSDWLASKDLINWSTMQCQVQIVSIKSTNLGDFQYLWEICDSIRWRHKWRPKGSLRPQLTHFYRWEKTGEQGCGRC